VAFWRSVVSLPQSPADVFLIIMIRASGHSASWKSIRCAGIRETHVMKIADTAITTRTPGAGRGAIGIVGGDDRRLGGGGEGG
jgi:hypothetical protein